MSQVELTRYHDAAQARVAARTLLGDGLHADVQRHGGDQVIWIDAAEFGRACALLGLDPDAAAGPDGRDTAEGKDSLAGAADEPATAEPPTVVVESVFGAGPTVPPPAPRSGTDGVGDDATLRDLPAPPDQAATAQVPEPASAPAKARRPDIDAEGYALIALVASHEAGAAMASKLLEAGIGVDLVDAVHAGYGVGETAHGGGPTQSGSQLVRVIPTDTDRALELLGLSTTDPPWRTRFDPAITPTTIDGEEVQGYLGGRLRVTRRQLTLMIIAYTAALILVPLFFFWATQQILDPGVDVPRPTLPGPSATRPS